MYEAINLICTKNTSRKTKVSSSGKKFKSVQILKGFSR